MMTSDQMAPPIEPTSGLDLGQVLKRRKLLLVIGLAAGLGLGYLYFIRQPPVYESVARVMLTQKQTKGVIDAAFVMQRERLANEIMEMRSDALLQDAMTIGELEKRPSFRSGRGALARGLKIEEIESTDVLQVSYRGSRSDDCRAAVDAVVKSYTDHIAKKRNDSHDEIKFIITEAISDLANDLKTLETSYEEFQETTQLLISNGETTDPYAENLASFGTKLTALTMKETEVTAEIQTLRAARQEGGDDAALAILADQGARISRFVTDNGTHKLDIAAGQKLPARPPVSFTNQLFQLKIDLAAARKQFGSRHPKVRELEDREAIIKQFAMKQEAAEVDIEVPLPEEQPQQIDYIGAYLNSLHLRLETYRQQKEKLSTMMAAEEEKSRSLRKDLARNDNLKAAIERKREAHREYMQKLKDVELVSAHEGRTATVIAPASVAAQVGPDRFKILAVGSVLGLMVGFGLACLIELADKSFRSPDDLMAELGIPVLSHIPFMRDAKKRKAGTTGVGNALITVIRPKSRTAEAYRSVRTALYFSTSGEVNKIVQVTSPVAGDGKSTLAGNLAVAIAHSGKRVLLVDADLRRPTVHKVFGLSNKDGVSTVVSGSCPLHEATHETEVENLSILTCGPRPDNPSEMLLSPEFEQLLEYVRAAFDFVVIDSPPILAVTDPASVAARADGVIITLRLAKRSRDLAKRAVDQLQNVGANILGVVVNGVDSVESYGYRSYSYGGYGYGGYGQGYGGYYANQNGYYDEGPVPKSASKRQTVVPERTNGKH